MYMYDGDLKEAIDNCMNLVVKESLDANSLRTMSESDLNGIKAVLTLVNETKKYIESCTKYMNEQDSKLDKILSEIKELKTMKS